MSPNDQQPHHPSFIDIQGLLEQASQAPKLYPVSQHGGPERFVSAEVVVARDHRIGPAIDRRGQNRVILRVTAARRDRRDIDHRPAMAELIEQIERVFGCDSCLKSRPAPDTIQLIEERIADQRLESTLLPGHKEGQGGLSAE